MFRLLLIPPVCGLLLFFGLLTATRTPLVRLTLTLVLTGLVAPVGGLLMHVLLPDLPLLAALGGAAVLCASLLLRLVPHLPVPTRHVRGICWTLVLLSCTLITVVITSPVPAGLPGSEAWRLVVCLAPFGMAHFLLSRGHSGANAKHPLRPTQPALPLLPRPLELVGVKAAYYPLASGLTAGNGPAAAFSCN